MSLLEVGDFKYKIRIPECNYVNSSTFIETMDASGDKCERLPAKKGVCVEMPKVSNVFSNLKRCLGMEKLFNALGALLFSIHCSTFVTLSPKILTQK